MWRTSSQSPSNSEAQAVLPVFRPCVPNQLRVFPVCGSAGGFGGKQEN